MQALAKLKIVSACRHQKEKNNNWQPAPQLLGPLPSLSFASFGACSACACSPPDAGWKVMLMRPQTLQLSLPARRRPSTYRAPTHRLMAARPLGASSKMSCKRGPGGGRGRWHAERDVLHHAACMQPRCQRLGDVWLCLAAGVHVA